MSKPLRLLSIISMAAVSALLTASAVVTGDDEKPPDADTIRQELHKAIDALEKKAEAKKDASVEEKDAAKEAKRALSDLNAQLKAIAAYEHGERELRGDVGGGFNGDKSPIDVDGATAEPNSGNVRSSNSEPVNNYKIDSAVTLTRGTYPQVFRLKTSIGVILTGKDFQEDVSSLRLSYGHFTAGGAVEIYGFAERISDSYMSIDQRWEVGGGTYIAFRRGLTKAAAREITSLCYDPDLKADLDDSAKVRSLNGWGAMTRPCKPRFGGASLTPSNPLLRAEAEAARAERKAQQKPQKERDKEKSHGAFCPDSYTVNGWDPVERTVHPAVFEKGRLDIDEEESKKAAQAIYHLRKLRGDAIRSIEQQGARYELGVAVSVLSEIERSTIKMLVEKNPAGGSTKFVPFPEPGKDTETKGVDAGGNQVFRLTLRPTVRLRPSTHIYFEGFSYIKMRIPPWKDVQALSGEAEVTSEEGKTKTIAVLEPRNDWRVDAHGEIRYILTGAETLGGEKFSIVGSYDFHFDSAPPFVLSPELSAQGISGIPMNSGLSARKRHHVFKILLTVGWGG